MQTATPPRPAESSAPATANGRGSAHPPDQSSAPGRRPLFVLWPEDGIATVLLAASVVYITIISIQSVTPAWAPGMQILSPLALIGLVFGYVAVQQRALPNALVHFLAFCLGCLIAFWMTADAVLGGGKRLLLAHLGTWLWQTYHQQTSNDNSIFLLFLAVLTYLLAYLTFWLVLHSRRPWLAVLANGVVLLINLNWAPPQELIFLVIFLLVALLLLVRFTLAENVRLWRTRHLRYSPDLGWDFLQAGAIFAVIVLLLAYNLPVGAANAQISAFVNNPNGIVQGIQQYWDTLFPGLNGPGTGGAGFFSSNLQLTGDVNLPNTEIFRYTSTDPAEYLATQTYDTYDGHADWSQSTTRTRALAADAPYPSPSSVTRTASQTITLTNVGSGGTRNLFAAGSPEAFTVPSNLSVTVDGGIPTGWAAQRTLVNGESYVAQSYLSNATVADLQAIQYPSVSAPDAYPASVLHLYLNNPGTVIAPLVAQTAAQWTQGAATPYAAAMDIEQHLKSAPFEYSLHNGTIPPNEDAVVWFLNNHKGFCTFFASTMALMMRSLGMPARIASGVSTGEYDPAKQNYVEKGTNLHVWTQVYFSGYGWINFEPTQSFQDFTRPVPGNTPGATSPTPQASGTAASRTPTRPRDQVGPTGTTPPSPTQTALRDLGLSLGFLLALLALVAAAVLVWWRALYRHLPLVAGAFARVTRLGAWSGHPPRPDQTPYEYTDELSTAVVEDAAPLHELSDLYVRERWGGTPAPQHETLTAYERVRGTLLKAIARRWREIPVWLLARLSGIGQARRRLGERFGDWIDRLLDPRGV